jgi:hypothetical protein
MSTIALVGQSTIAMVDMRVLGFGATVAVRLVHAACAAAALAILALDRRRSLRAAEIAFALVAIPFLPSLLVAQWQFAAAGRDRPHDTWYELVMLGVALFAPAEPILPSLIIAVAAVQYCALSWIVGTATVSRGEPWTTVLFAAISIAMVVGRVHRRRAAVRSARLLARAIALERVTSLLLRARDLANTPLQTIELCTELAARDRPPPAHVVLAMRRATARLRRLSSMLERARVRVERAALGDDQPTAQNPS